MMLKVENHFDEALDAYA
jgi:hypothetical protein